MIYVTVFAWRFSFVIILFEVRKDCTLVHTEILRYLNYSGYFSKGGRNSSFEKNVSPVKKFDILTSRKDQRGKTKKSSVILEYHYIALLITVLGKTQM